MSKCFLMLFATQVGLIYLNKFRLLRPDGCHKVCIKKVRDDKQ